jgi:DNA-binding transcriptional regulator LsrR (DeoR family)
MSSIKDQAIAYVYANPGQTATQISKAIGIKRSHYGYGTVSSLLCKAANKGLIRRALSHKDVWQYYPKDNK